MKERPILFSGSMVRALLDGGKTQTRRILEPQPGLPNLRPIWLPKENRKLYSKGKETSQIFSNGIQWVTGLDEEKQISSGEILANCLNVCPYGQPGDQLWVRETFTVESNRRIESEAHYPPPFNDGRPILRQEEADEEESYWRQCHYRATDSTPELAYEYSDSTCIWKPSIHMPRWASRIQLEITGVRVERLQNISEADAKAEGVQPNWCGPLDKGPNGEVSEGWLGDEWIHYQHGEDGPPAYSAKESYQSLWESINGPGSWDANPFVWVVEFKRVKP